MRKKTFLTILVLILASGLAWGQFWKTYTDAQRQTVGEAYWLAGKQYQAVGEKDKGSEYMTVARLVYPQLDPASIKDTALPSAAELLAQGRTVTIGSGAAAIPTGAINSFFLRFVGSLVDEDPAGVVGFLDGSVYFSRLSSDVTRADALSALTEFFKAASLKGTEPSAVYDLESIVVAAAPQSMQAAWGETYSLAVNARADYSGFLNVWDQRQQFYIHRESGNWYIFAIGQAPPPLSWSPQKPGAAAAVQVVLSEPDAGAAITNAYTTFMSDILKKDADGALGHASDSIRFLRLRQTVTKDELKTTLLGYFDSADFGSTALSDVVDLDSAFVQPAASPVEGVTGSVYVLNIKAKADLSASIPFWSMYQKYYFVNEGSQWLVFALL
jgi:hypothetical protein